MFELADATDVYTFWLGNGPKGTAKSVWKAVVDRDNLIQFKTPELIIPTRDIRSLHSGGCGLRADRYWAFGVTLVTDAETFELFPVNPMMPNPAGGENGDETSAFYEVVTALWQHRKPHYEKDPYIRQHVASHRKMLHEFDGNVSPMIYFNRGKLWSRPARMELPMVILSIVLTFVGLMAIIGLVYALLGR